MREATCLKEFPLFVDLQGESWAKNMVMRRWSIRDFRSKVES